MKIFKDAARELKELRRHLKKIKDSKALYKYKYGRKSPEFKKDFLGFKRQVWGFESCFRELEKELLELINKN